MESYRSCYIGLCCCMKAMKAAASAARDGDEEERAKNLQLDISRLKHIDDAKYEEAEEDSSDDSIDKAELASWTQVCVTVLASDLGLLLY